MAVWEVSDQNKMDMSGTRRLILNAKVWLAAVSLGHRRRHYHLAAAARQKQNEIVSACWLLMASAWLVLF